jgi:hypothetical protein
MPHRAKPKGLGDRLGKPGAGKRLRRGTLTRRRLKKRGRSKREKYCGLRKKGRERGWVELAGNFEKKQ